MLPFEMTPWRILDGDWPRLGWYEHLLPAVARTGQLCGWSPSVQEHVQTPRSSITEPADARTILVSAVQRLGQAPCHSTARTIELLTDLQLLAEDRPDPGDPWCCRPRYLTLWRLNYLGGAAGTDSAGLHGHRRESDHIA